jgi:hypothetical protein
LSVLAIQEKKPMKRRNESNSKDDQSVRSRTSAGKSVGEQVVDEERPQTGGSRSETKLSGRAPNQSRSRQTIVDEIVNVEGEQEPEFQNAGGGQPRQRANQQSAATQGDDQENVSAENPGPRGREDSSIRGRESGLVRGEDTGSEKVQGITNRSSRQENLRQQKVAPKRAEGKPARGSGKRRAG